MQDAGPQGFTGPTGPTGLTGPTGATGLTGPCDVLGRERKWRRQDQLADIRLKGRLGPRVITPSNLSEEFGDRHRSPAFAWGTNFA